MSTLFSLLDVLYLSSKIFRARLETYIVGCALFSYHKHRCSTCASFHMPSTRRQTCPHVHLQHRTVPSPAAAHSLVDTQTSQTVSMVGNLSKSYVSIIALPHWAFRSSALCSKSYVGRRVGVLVGLAVGWSVGLCDIVGVALGDVVGIKLGASDAVIDGSFDAVTDGSADAVIDGSDEAVTDGLEDGAEVTGAIVGVEDGCADNVGTVDGELDGASVITEAESCPHLPHVLGQAASPLVRTPSSAEQYFSIRCTFLATQLHFLFFFSTLDGSTRALESLQVLDSYVHGLPHVTGQMTAARGVRYPARGWAPIIPQ